MPAKRLQRTCWRLVFGAATATAVVMTRPTWVLAQDDDTSLVPNPEPNASIPGSSLIVDILGWLKYGALAAAVAGLLIGGIAIAVGSSGSHYGASSAGRRWLLGGIGAAIVAGLAHAAVITVYEASV